MSIIIPYIPDQMILPSMGLCPLAATKLRGDSGTDDRFLSSVGPLRFGEARQATKGDGLSHEEHEIFAAVEEAELVAIIQNAPLL
jgi:hypothetical protein